MEKQRTKTDPLVEFHPRISVTLISGGHVISIPFGDIIHVSKHGQETNVHTTTKVFRTYYSLQEIQNELPVNEFIRIHKSHVVALRYMDGVKKGRLKVGEYFLPITNWYKKEVIRLLADRLNQYYQ